MKEYTLILWCKPFFVFPNLWHALTMQDTTKNE